MSGAEVVVAGVRLGEGPVWRPATRDLVCTSVSDGRVWRIDTDRGDKEVFADTGGGPNGAAARLGLKRSTLQFRMRKVGISRHPGWRSE